MVRFFIELLGGNNAMAASVYLALEGKGPKSKAIEVAADHALKEKPDQSSLLRVILEIAATNQKARDKLTRWTWGYSPSLPDALLLVNPKTGSEKVLDKSEVFVYREADFREIIEANDRLCGYCLHFQWILQGHIANADNKLVNQLFAVAEIRERLTRRNSAA